MSTNVLDLFEEKEFWSKSQWDRVVFIELNVLPNLFKVLDTNNYASTLFLVYGEMSTVASTALPKKYGRNLRLYVPKESLREWSNCAASIVAGVMWAMHPIVKQIFASPYYRVLTTNKVMEHSGVANTHYVCSENDLVFHLDKK